MTSLLKIEEFVITRITNESLIGETGCAKRSFLTEVEKDSEEIVWNRKTGNAMACQSSGSDSTRQCKELSLDQMYSTHGTTGRASVSRTERFNPTKEGLEFPSCDVDSDKIDVAFGQLIDVLHERVKLNGDWANTREPFCNSRECVLLCWFMFEIKGSRYWKNAPDERTEGCMPKLRDTERL